MLTKLYVRATTALRREEGATALEYGVLVALIALVIVVGVGLFGQALNNFFTGLAARAHI